MDLFIFFYAQLIFLLLNVSAVSQVFDKKGQQNGSDL